MSQTTYFKELRVRITGDDRSAQDAFRRTDEGAKKAAGSVSEIAREMIKASGAGNAAKAAMDQYRSTVERLSRETALAGKHTAEAAARYDTTRGALRSLTDAERAHVVELARLRDATLKAAAAQERIRKAWADVPASMQAFGRSMSLYVTAPLMAVAAMGVNSAVSLQKAVARISTVKPSIDTSQVFDALNDMQRRVPFTAQELADELYDIFSSVSVAPDQGLKLLEKFAMGATAADTDVKAFGTSVMGVMNAFKLQVKDVDHVMDAFFNTVNAGVVTGRELAESLGPVTSAAKALGASVDETFAVIAAVTKEGGPAAQNINNAANLFSKIYGAEAREGWKRLGIEVTDAAGNFKPLLDNVEALKQKMKDWAPSDRAGFLSKMLPDFQARQGLQTLMSQLDMAKEQLRANQTESGAAKEAYQKMADTAAVAGQILKNVLSSELIKLGKELLPDLERALRTAADWIKGMPDWMKKWAVQIGVVSMALGPGVGLVGSLARGATGVLEFIGTLRNWKRAADAAKAAQDALNLSAAGGAGAGAAGRVAGLGVAGTAGLAAIPVVGVAAIARESYKDPRSVMHGGPKFGLNTPPASTGAYDRLMRDIGMRPGAAGSAIPGLSPQVAGALGLPGASPVLPARPQLPKPEVKPTPPPAAAGGAKASPAVSSAVRAYIDGEGRGGRDSAGKIIEEMALGLSTPQAKYSCALFASRLLQEMGHQVPSITGARDLAKYYEDRGARRMDPRLAGPGDLIVWHGKGYGNPAMRDAQGRGYHVGVSVGDRRVADSSGGRTRVRGVFDLKNAYALDITKDMAEKLTPEQDATRKVEELTKGYRIALQELGQESEIVALKKRLYTGELAKATEESKRALLAAAEETVSARKRREEESALAEVRKRNAQLIAAAKDPERARRAEALGVDLSFYKRHEAALKGQADAVLMHAEAEKRRAEALERSREAMKEQADALAELAGYAKETREGLMEARGVRRTWLDEAKEKVEALSKAILKTPAHPWVIGAAGAQANQILEDARARDALDLSAKVMGGVEGANSLLMQKTPGAEMIEDAKRRIRELTMGWKELARVELKDKMTPAQLEEYLGLKEREREIELINQRKEAFRSMMEEQLGLLIKGKASFGDFFRSIVSGLRDMLVQQAAANLAGLATNAVFRLQNRRDVVQSRMGIAPGEVGGVPTGGGGGGLWGTVFNAFLPAVLGGVFRRGGGGGDGGGLYGGPFQAAFAGLSGREGGGWVSAGEVVSFNEGYKQQEILVPRVPMQVYPSAAAAGGAGSGAATVVKEEHYHFDIQGEKTVDAVLEDRYALVSRLAGRAQYENARDRVGK